MYKVKEPTSFKDIRTVEGHEYNTYREACLALGLLENDNQWNETLQQGAHYDSPAQHRTLIAVIPSYCEPFNPQALWDRHKDSMSEDILNTLRRENPDITLNYTDAIYNHALIKLEKTVLWMCGKPLSEIGTTAPLRQDAPIMSREIFREFSYDTHQMRQFLQEHEPLLNAEQRRIYDALLQRHNNGEHGIFFIDAPGGTGKTFLINVLLATFRAQHHIALAVATSGIAATLMTGGRTAHSMLQIPIDLIHNETPVCNIRKGSPKATVLREAKILFWDEISMMHKHGLEAVNRTLQDIRGNCNLMGGLIVVLAGDFRQTLPVIPRGTMADEIKACIKSSRLWKDVQIMKLHTNMRTQQQINNSHSFSDYLLHIGDGKEPTTDRGKITLSTAYCNICSTVDSLLNQVYPDLTSNIHNHNWLKERAILTPLNANVIQLNLKIQDKVPTASTTYFSIDSCVNDDEATTYPVEFLNSLHPSGIPPHALLLKVGSPIMLLRNIDPPKLCNGSRLIVKALHVYIIKATILTGPFRGEDVLIPRIGLNPTDLPFTFKRLQFPVTLAFAMTINKAQGQSLQVTGLDLSDECFSHGQLYVAMSRAKDPSKLFIHAHDRQTKNIVYSQVLQ